MARRRINYITSGRRWKWGWHRYEAQTMVWLLVIVTIMAILGLIVGVMISVAAGLPLVVGVLVTVAAFCIATIVGLAIVKAVAEPIWALLTTKGEEG